jgi:Uma2 family endonuclease
MSITSPSISSSAFPSPAPLAEKLITVDELLAMPDDGRHTELVRGRIIEMPPPQMPHGKACLAIAGILVKYLEQYDVGHATVNDTGVITERNPDSVRGADAAFGSYFRVPKDQPPQGYWPVAPEIVFEVLSPGDRPGATFTKVSEYLAAGVVVVLVIDPEEYQIHVNAAKQLPQTLGFNDEINLKQFLPDSVPEWTVAVREFFKFFPSPLSLPKS